MHRFKTIARLHLRSKAFVNEEFRARRIGRGLVMVILERAKEYGYEVGRLEFGELFQESKILYKSIEAYTDIPDRLKPKMEFMEFRLR